MFCISRFDTKSLFIHKVKWNSTRSKQVKLELYELKLTKTKMWLLVLLWWVVSINHVSGFCVRDKISFASFVKCQRLLKKVALQILF